MLTFREMFKGERVERGDFQNVRNWKFDVSGGMGFLNQKPRKCQLLKRRVSTFSTGRCHNKEKKGGKRTVSSGKIKEKQTRIPPTPIKNITQLC